MDKKKKHGKFFWGFVAVVIAFFFGLFLSMVMITHAPGRYKPAFVTNKDEISPYLTHQLGPDFFNQVQLDKPFELVIDQQGLNDMLARNDWPQFTEELTFYQPMIAFYPGRLMLMQKIEYRGFAGVLTVAAEPMMDAGGHLNLNITAVQLGALPITPIAYALASKYIDRAAFDIAEMDWLERICIAAINNQPFDPVFKINKWILRLTDFQSQPNKLILKIDPVKIKELK